MAVQRSTTVPNYPFLLKGPGYQKAAETVVQDAGRSGDMELYTLMAIDNSTGKWTSFTDETGTDGTQFPRGILMKTLTEADIKAGDISDVPILMYDAIVDKNQVVIENSKTLATVINSPANLNITVEQALGLQGLYMQDVVHTTEIQS